MQYISTRNKDIKVSASKAILDGIAYDGGLYVPESFPEFSIKDIKVMTQMNYAERLAEVLTKFLTDFSYDELLEYATLAGKKFDPDECPLMKVDDGLYIIELFHGPTFAFKDMALSIMPYLTTAAKQKQGEKSRTLILVATSGDTGKAALEGFKDIEGIDVAVFYPADGVSAVQKAQMTTTSGENVYVAAVNGNFDDAQTAVKSAFLDKEFAEKLRAKGYKLSSANSINIGRLLPQIAYYFSAYCDLLASDEIQEGEEVDFCVPTGNFGNILAAYYAKKCGLPVGKLICASNKNKILTDFFESGEYDTNREFYKTMSPSMDILISSNFERLLFDLADRDDKLLIELFSDLKKTGKFCVSDDLLAKCNQLFYANSADEIATAQTIEHFYDEYEYALDPHTAVAVTVYEAHLNLGSETNKCVIVATASPFKFASDVYSALTTNKIKQPFDAIYKLAEYTALEIPVELASLENRQHRFKDVIDPLDIADVVRKNIVY